MQDIDAVIDFLVALPAPAEPAADALNVHVYSRGEMRRAVQSLGRRGYIGCLPFADNLVVRLLPEQPPSKCPICVVFKTDAFTIAPAMTHFVAGRLALNDATKLAPHERTDEAILDYATSLGSAASARAVLTARSRARPVERIAVRQGMLWAAAGEFDPLFEALGGAWMYHQKEVTPWLRTLSGETLRSHIVDRVSVGSHTELATGEDVSEPAWRIVSGDHVFDLGYTGFIRGPTLGARLVNALVYAVKFLSEKRTRHKQMDSPLWRAAQAAVDDFRYGGEAHYDTARAIASRDAASAYTLLANAARYASRSNKPLMPRIVDLALELATAGKWQTLAGTLKLAQTAFRKAT